MAFTKVLGPGIHTLSNITSHNIHSSGIVTAVSFVGDGSGLTGVASTDNIITGTAATFNTYPVDINAGMTVAGVATFSGNLTVGGVLTYEDVKNVDSIGVVTARNGIDCNADLDVDGHTNLDNISIAGVTTVANDTYFTLGSNATANSNLRIRANSSSTRNEYRSTYQDFFATDLRIRNISTNNHLAYFWNSEVAFFQGGTKRLSTAPAGANVYGNLQIESTSPYLILKDTNNDNDFGLNCDNGSLNFVDTTDSYTTRMSINSSGNVSILRDLDVDGHTNLDNVSVAGVSTFTGSVGAQGQIQSTYNHASQPRLYLSGISGSGGYNYLLRGDNDAGSRAVHFVNGSARSADNGANTYTIRNDNGKLHLGKTNQLAVLQGSTTYLQHGSSTKLQTSSTGVTVTGTVAATTFSGSGASLTSIPSGQLTGALPAIDGSNLTGIDTDLVSDTSPQLGGTLDVNGQVVSFDDASGVNVNRAKFGTGDDLHIYHNGSNSTIRHEGTGSLLLNTTTGSIQMLHNSENMLIATPDGAVELYHNNSKKLETSSLGATITGRLVSDGLDIGDSESIRFGTGYDMNMYHDGSNGVINNGTGNFYIFGGNGAIYLRPSTDDEHGVVVSPNSSVQLYHNGNLKLETVSYGVEVTGQLIADNGLKVPDAKHITLGTDNDLRLYFDGSNAAWNNQTGNSYFYGGGGNFYIRPVNAEQALNILANGSVELFHDNTKMAYTSSSGFDVTNGDLRSHLNIKVLNDNQKLLIGAGNDLQLYHSGSHSIINNITGSFQVHDAGTEKFRVSGTGTFFKDDITLSNDNDKLNIGAGNDLQIYHSGTNTYISNSTGTLFTLTDIFEVKGSNANETHLKTVDNGAVELYHNGTKRFETTSNGNRTNGELLYLGPNNITNFIHSGGNISLTADTSIYFVADCNDTSGDAPNGEFIWGGGSNTNTDANQDFTLAEFGNSGQPRDQYMILDEFSLRPANNNDLDLGASSNRWKTIYTMDLELSNKGSVNSVDGTWGDWTLQEGENDIYMINNRTGKKFKIKMEAVD